MPSPSKNQKSHKRLLTILVAGVIFMFGFCYMLIPLYQLVCKTEGYNGKGVLAATSVNPGMQIDKSRTIKVFFSTTLHGRLPFSFLPVQRSIDIHPGETKLIYFYAENQSGKDLTVQAVPSITPGDAARYLKKTECFCFTQQYFFKNEKADMPVYFFIDPAIPKEIKEVTLSYTLFDATGYEKKLRRSTTGRIDL